MSSPLLGGEGLPRVIERAPLEGGMAAFSQMSENASLKQIAVPCLWDPNNKCKNLVLSENRLRVSYKGTGKFDTDAAAIRTERPIPPSCGLFYFEILIVSKGRDG